MPICSHLSKPLQYLLPPHQPRPVGQSGAVAPQAHREHVRALEAIGVPVGRATGGKGGVGEGKEEKASQTGAED